MTNMEARTGFDALDVCLTFLYAKKSTQCITVRQ